MLRRLIQKLATWAGVDVQPGIVVLCSCEADAEYVGRPLGAVVTTDYERILECVFNGVNVVVPMNTTRESYSFPYDVTVLVSLQSYYHERHAKPKPQYIH